MDYTTLNFVSLDHLLPQLVASHRRAIADLGRDLMSLEEPQVRAMVEVLLAQKQQHLQSLEKLAGANRNTVQASLQ